LTWNRLARNNPIISAIASGYLQVHRHAGIFGKFIVETDDVDLGAPTADC
jgi:hypothetical protein